MEFARCNDDAEGERRSSHGARSRVARGMPKPGRFPSDNRHKAKGATAQTKQASASMQGACLQQASNERAKVTKDTAPSDNGGKSKGTRDAMTQAAMPMSCQRGGKPHRITATSQATPARAERNRVSLTLQSRFPSDNGGKRLDEHGKRCTALRPWLFSPGRSFFQYDDTS